MSNEEAKRIVSAGLERQRDARQTAEHEARLERYEMDQIRGISENCAGARMKREAEERTRQSIQQAEARRAAIAQARAEQQRKEDAAMAACRYYGLTCLGILWLTSMTHLPIWAAITLALGLGVFPAAYIFRLYFPIESKANA